MAYQVDYGHHRRWLFFLISKSTWSINVDAPVPFISRCWCDCRYWNNPRGTWVRAPVPKQIYYRRSDPPRQWTRGSQMNAYAIPQAGHEHWQLRKETRFGKEAIIKHYIFTWAVQWTSTEHYMNYDQTRYRPWLRIETSIDIFLRGRGGREKSC